MEYYDGKLCISMRELVGGGIMTEANYKQMARRGRLKVARYGRGTGNYALVIVDSLPNKYSDKLAQTIGFDAMFPMFCWLRDNYKRDLLAVAWFNDLSKCPIELSDKKREEYIVNASLLNSCIYLHERPTLMCKLAGESYQWEKMVDAIKSLHKHYRHTLPSSVFRFRKKITQYRKDGYSSLISGKFGNSNAKK